MKLNAAKAPGWVRSIAAVKFDPAGERKFRDYKLGTFGAAKSTNGGRVNANGLRNKSDDCAIVSTENDLNLCCEDGNNEVN